MYSNDDEFRKVCPSVDVERDVARGVDRVRHWELLRAQEARDAAERDERVCRGCEGDGKEDKWSSNDLGSASGEGGLFAASGKRKEVTAYVEVLHRTEDNGDVKVMTGQCVGDLFQPCALSAGDCHE